MPTVLEAMAEAGALHDDTLMRGGTVEEADENANKSFFANAALIGVTNKLSGIFDWSRFGKPGEKVFSIGNKLTKSVVGGMAIAGMVCGIVGIGLWLVLIVFIGVFA